MSERIAVAATCLISALTIVAGVGRSAESRAILGPECVEGRC